MHSERLSCLGPSLGKSSRLCARRCITLTSMIASWGGYVLPSKMQVFYWDHSVVVQPKSACTTSKATSPASEISLLCHAREHCWISALIGRTQAGSGAVTRAVTPASYASCLHDQSIINLLLRCNFVPSYTTYYHQHLNSSLIASPTTS